MNAPNIDAIQARADSATPGPWELDEYDQAERAWVIMNSGVGPYQHAVAAVSILWTRPRAEANARFIAHARQDVDVLLAMVDRLELAQAQAIKHISHVTRSRDAYREGWLLRGRMINEGRCCGAKVTKS